MHVSAPCCSPPTSVLSFKLGNDVMVSYFLHCKTQLDPSYRSALESSMEAFLDWFADPSGKEMNHRFLVPAFNLMTERTRGFLNYLYWYSKLSYPFSVLRFRIRLSGPDPDKKCIHFKKLIFLLSQCFGSGSR